jgi:hypothetical protein
LSSVLGSRIGQTKKTQMTGHGAKFQKKKEAIVALLTRWLNESEFVNAYRAARRAAFSQAIARLQQASATAVTALIKSDGRSGYASLDASPCSR